MDDPNRETGPNAIARKCEETIASLEAERDALPRSERKAINQKLHNVQYILRWCKTRAGYFSTGVS